MNFILFLYEKNDIQKLIIACDPNQVVTTKTNYYLETHQIKHIKT